MSRIFIVQVECVDSADNYTVEVRAKDKDEAAHTVYQNLHLCETTGHVYPKYKTKKKKK
jgi:hypothetical protein